MKWESRAAFSLGCFIISFPFSRYIKLHGSFADPSPWKAHITVSKAFDSMDGVNEEIQPCANWRGWAPLEEEVKWIIPLSRASLQCLRPILGLCLPCSPVSQEAKALHLSLHAKRVPRLAISPLTLDCPWPHPFKRHQSRQRCGGTFIRNGEWRSPVFCCSERKVHWHFRRRQVGQKNLKRHTGEASRRERR